MKTVVDIVTIWLMVGVRLNDSGDADRPVTEGTETVQLIDCV